jgi:hypothetical protein
MKRRPLPQDFSWSPKPDGGPSRDVAEERFPRSDLRRDYFLAVLEKPAA